MAVGSTTTTSSVEGRSIARELQAQEIQVAQVEQLSTSQMGTTIIVLVMREDDGIVQEC